MYCYFLFIYFTANRSGHEQRLFRDLTSGYNVISRPIRNASKPVKLKFGVALNQILDLVGMYACNITLTHKSSKGSPFKQLNVELWFRNEIRARLSSGNAS